jgi:hypothetical protein
MAFTAVTIEGGLFPGDLVERLASGAETSGQRPEDFGLRGSHRLSDEIQAAFSDMRSYWDAFQRRQAKSKESLTTLTREYWVIPFLEDLGFNLVYQRPAATVGNDTYAFSHRAGEDPKAPPVHIIALDQDLDRRGEFRRSPHALVQEYLNRSDSLWGLVTNGQKLRLLRDTARLAKPNYVEFDLEALITGNLYSEFVLLYRLLHRSRFPLGAADAPECWLEKYYQQGIEEGGRVRDHLRDGVEVALLTLGNAFLTHPDSDNLRQALQEGRLSAYDYFRQLLRLVYRLLFLMVAEERRLLFPPEGMDPALQAIYTRYYSLSRLRERCEQHRGEDPYHDLWIGLRQTFRIFQDGNLAGKLGLAPLDGELFGPLACGDLEGAGCENGKLLEALYHLSTFADDRVRRRVNYAGLDVEELGSIYESLLEYHPQVVIDDPPRFDLAWGSERKQTGSYYTPSELVRELIETALVPVVEERLAGAKTEAEKEAALRKLKVCDPASGSGHFLLAAARRLGRELARVRTGELEPSPEAYRIAVRDIIRECLYAVDKNPLAVDLCKVALWLEGHCAGLPLSFLDHHIKCGDSLVGVMDLAVLKDGIPDDAYKPVTGDDRQSASQYKRRNREERQGQSSLFREQLARAMDGPRTLAPDFAALAELAELTPQDVHDKAKFYGDLRKTPTWHHLHVVCDLWTAAFFAHLSTTKPGQSPLVPTTATVWGYLSQGSIQARLEAEAITISRRHPFFHWPLEFPEVFTAGGFDVVMGNPPWEQLQPEEIKFFKGQQVREIWELSGAQRKRAIENLFRTNPELAKKWEDYKTGIERENKFIRTSERFQLTAVGKINTYPLFADVAWSLINQHGRVGIIVPSGIATDDTTKLFFQDLMDRRTLVSLYDFENRQKIFPGIDSRIKFCLLTLAGGDRPEGVGAKFAFFLQRVDELRDAGKCFSLTGEDLALLNPNTRTCPIFRSPRDAEITKSIYRRVPVLIKDGVVDGNPWGVQFRQGLFNMTSDSHLFRTPTQLEGEGWRLTGNIFRRGEEVYLPLYEAKMMHHFDHRWATYEGTDTRDVTLREKADPSFLALPRYWVPEEEVKRRVPRQPEMLVSALGVPESRRLDAVSRTFCYWMAGYWRQQGDEDKAEKLLKGALPAHMTDTLGDVFNRWIVEEQCEKMQERFPITDADISRMARAVALDDHVPLAEELVERFSPHWFLDWRDIARSTDERTVIAGVLPLVGVGNNLPLMVFNRYEPYSAAGLAANLSACCYDFVARQNVGGAHLNFFIYKQLPVLPPSTYDQPCLWSGGESLKGWLAPRVLELTYTAHDLSPFAKDLSYDGPPFSWDEERRFLVRCELDSAFFHLYGLTQEETDYIMDTFFIVKRKDEARYGEYRTKRVILEIYNDMQRAISLGATYSTRLDPPPGGHRAAHSAI